MLRRNKTNRQTWYSILNWRWRSTIPNGHLRHCWKRPKWIWNRSRLHDHTGLARSSVKNATGYTMLNWIMYYFSQKKKTNHKCRQNSFVNCGIIMISAKTMLLNYRYKITIWQSHGIKYKLVSMNNQVFFSFFAYTILHIRLIVILFFLHLVITNQCFNPSKRNY